MGALAESAAVDLHERASAVEDEEFIVVRDGAVGADEQFFDNDPAGYLPVELCDPALRNGDDAAPTDFVRVDLYRDLDGVPAL